MLFNARDCEYAAFQSKLTPTVAPQKFIGVRVPVLRKLAAEIAKCDFCGRFLCELPHYYYEENMLHALIISQINNYDKCIAELERFLPFIDNWAVCDSLSPKCFKSNKELVILKIEGWVNSKHPYTCRFGLEMLMKYFLDEHFKQEYLNIAAGVNSEEYYVKMMVAWLFATALAKQWSSAVIYLENDILSKWVKNKTIQKACESYRITLEQKQYLKSIK